MVKKAYQLIVGLEIHVQLKTKSKIFSADPSAYGSLPNKNIGVITLAHPGTLPKLNLQVIEFAVKMGLACHSDITREFIFDRKNYFYPDLPKGYQLTQDRTPICLNGYIPVRLKEGKSRKIRLFRIHLEEDAGKSMHNSEALTSVDYNRAGIPLIEIVTQPEINSTEEATAVLAEIRRMVRYLGISDGDMEKGSLRCDANISVRPIGNHELGEKVEIKNMNSIRNLARAISYEEERQINILQAGEEITSETRTFNPERGTTSSMRSKENLNDYRYFPEPDLSPVLISEEDLASWKSEMPLLPKELFDLFHKTYRLSSYDSEVLLEDPGLAAFACELFEVSPFKKQAANWLMGPVKSWLNMHHAGVEEFPIRVSQLSEIISMVQRKELGHSNAVQKLFPFLLENPEMYVLDAANQLNLLLEKNDSDIQPVIDVILNAYPEKVKAYQDGKKGLLGLFMGELMKKTQGRVDAKMANKLLMESLKS